jgi:hypothetical protein
MNMAIIQDSKITFRRLLQKTNFRKMVGIAPKSGAIAIALILYFLIYGFFGYKIKVAYKDSFWCKYDGEYLFSLETVTPGYPFSIEPEGASS